VKSNTTEVDLIEIIANHQLENGCKKISVTNLANSAQISRTAFYKYYDHLKDYANGDLSVFHLLPTSLQEKYLLKCIEYNQQLKETIAKKEKNASIEKECLEEKFITTLMNSDISVLNATEVNADREKQAIHNSRLVQKNQKLEDEISTLKITETRSTEEGESYDNEIVVVPINLSSALKKFKLKGDYDLYEDSKSDAIESLIKKVNKLNDIQSNRVVIFIERYLSGFDKFCNQYINNSSETVIIIQLPVFTKLELLNFVSKLSNYMSIDLFFPFSDSDVITKAQRTFLFKGIPKEELSAADRSSTPNTSYRLDRIVIHKVQQGE
jgi:hypothetical protein